MHYLSTVQWKNGENDGKIKEIKTIGRGYNKFENFRVVILFFCDSLYLYPHDSEPNHNVWFGSEKDRSYQVVISLKIQC